MNYIRIIVPDDEYVREVATLCKKHNVLLINDEIQSVSVSCNTSLHKLFIAMMCAIISTVTFFVHMFTRYVVLDAYVNRYTSIDYYQ